MPRPPQPLPPNLGDVFSVAEASDAGVPAGRLRALDLDRPFRGVRVRREPDPDDSGEADERPSEFEIARAHAQRSVHAYAKIMQPDAFFAGRTAGSLMGLPVDPGPTLVVGVTGPARAPRRIGIRGVKIKAGLVHVHEHDGLRMTTPGSTWAMLGAELAVGELVAVGDAIVRIPRDEKGDLRPERQLATIAQLEKAVSAGRRVGLANLREALALVRVGSSSPLESDLRVLSVASDLPEFELDVEIFDRHGKRIGISEFFHRPTRTVIEVEGDHHRVDRKQWNRDIEKYAAYATEGIEVVRLTSAHIRGNHPRAVKMMRDALLRRGWNPE